MTIGFLETLVDSSWATKFSCSGAMFFIHGCLFHWFSKIQRSVSLSSAEAEYFGVMMAARDLIFVRELLIDLGFTISKPSAIACDSKSAVDMAFDPVAFKKTKHILRAAEFLRDLVKREVLTVHHLSGSIMIADILTKAVARPLFIDLMRLLDNFAASGVASPAPSSSPPPSPPSSPPPDGEPDDNSPASYHSANSAPAPLTDGLLSYDERVSHGWVARRRSEPDLRCLACAFTPTLPPICLPCDTDDPPLLDRVCQCPHLEGRVCGSIHTVGDDDLCLLCREMAPNGHCNCPCPGCDPPQRELITDAPLEAEWPSCLWHLPHRLWNRFIHALIGNTTCPHCGDTLHPAVIFYEGNLQVIDDDLHGTWEMVCHTCQSYVGGADDPPVVEVTAFSDSDVEAFEELPSGEPEPAPASTSASATDTPWTSGNPFHVRPQRFYWVANLDLHVFYHSLCEDDPNYGIVMVPGGHERRVELSRLALPHAHHLFHYSNEYYLWLASIDDDTEEYRGGNDLDAQAVTDWWDTVTPCCFERYIHCAACHGRKCEACNNVCSPVYPLSRVEHIQAPGHDVELAVPFCVCDHCDVD